MKKPHGSGGASEQNEEHYPGEVPLPGSRVVFLDLTDRKVYLPNAKATGRVFWGISTTGWDDPGRQRSVRRRGMVAVDVDRGFDGETLNVHAASEGDEMRRRGTLTSAPVSSEVGHEVIALDRAKVSLHEASLDTGRWKVSVNLP